MTCGVVLFNCVGALIAYNNIFGSICLSIYLLFKDANPDSIFADRKIYILGLACLNLPVIFRRTVGELKFISLLLFASIITFIVALFIQLGINGTTYNFDLDFGAYWGFHADRQSVTAITIFLWSYSFQLMLFSSFRSLEKRTPEEGNRSVLSTVVII